MFKTLRIISVILFALVLFVPIILILILKSDFPHEWLSIVCYCIAFIITFSKSVFIIFIRLARKYGEPVSGKVTDYYKGSIRAGSERTPLVTFTCNGQEMSMHTLNTYYLWYKPFQIGNEVNLLYTSRYSDLVMIANSRPEISHIVFWAASSAIYIFIGLFQ